MDSYQIFELFLKASVVVQIIMGGLLLASVCSWVLIVKKIRQFNRAEKGAAEFENRFWSGADLATLYDSQAARKGSITSSEAIFGAGFREFMRLRGQSSIARSDVFKGVRRQMIVQQRREIEELEISLQTLASIGSVSPYVGLFGTVWGIMGSFGALAENEEAATIKAVAPDLSEALVATALGLFTAIPAVVAFNTLTNRLDRVEQRYETFIDEFLGILERHADALD